jgi:hypothetical protein
MADKNPAQAITTIKRIEMLCDFLENPAVVKAVDEAIPFTGITRAPGALGFDIPLWMGLGTVGLWAALDAFSERAALPRTKCAICKRMCIRGRFGPYARDNEEPILGELDESPSPLRAQFRGRRRCRVFQQKTARA